MLALKMRIGESFRIGDFAVVTVQGRDGNTVKLTVDADKSIPVRRVESSTQAQLAGKMGLGEAVAT